MRFHRNNNYRSQVGDSPDSNRNPRGHFPGPVPREILQSGYSEGEWKGWESRWQQTRKDIALLRKQSNVMAHCIVYCLYRNTFLLLDSIKYR